LSTDKKILIVIAGPTASGKTGVAIETAKRLNTEVVSADSRQIFREMKIGTARPDKSEMQNVPHHLLGHVSIHDTYHAGKYEEDALNAIENIFKKNNYAVVCGGTGLYISALLNGFDPLPERNEKIREELKKNGIESLRNQLRELDPVYYKKIDLHNAQRLIRAIELCILTGRKHDEIKTGLKKNRTFSSYFFVLNPERELLYSRINLRVDEMITKGWEEEARKLFPYKELNSLQTVGYKEWFDFFEGKTSREETIELIKQHTRNYAKRQLTWFRKQEGTIWIKPENAATEIIKQVTN
jgi:tRNA dimethylallyltransferase